MIGKVLESSALEITVRMEFEDFERNKDDLKIGKYLQISVGNHDFVIATINAIKAVDDNNGKEKYLIISEPIGMSDDDGFKPGSTLLPSPTEPADIAREVVLDKIFHDGEKYTFLLGKLVQNKSVDLKINGNIFFGKHIGIVGSTGSGKSCTVAKILQEAVGIKDAQNKNNLQQKNAHIVIFDIHSEYRAAFSLEEEQNFSLNYLDVENLKLPYWLLNSEELESIFIESNEANSHNQISQFRRAVILNKEKYNPELDKITYDTPVYFSIKEVYNYIYNMNNEVISKIAEDEQRPKIIEGNEKKLISDPKQYFEKKYTFIPANFYLCFTFTKLELW